MLMFMLTLMSQVKTIEALQNNQQFRYYIRHNSGTMVTRQRRNRKNNLVPRVSLLPGRKDERPWERGCRKKKQNNKNMRSFTTTFDAYQRIKALQQPENSFRGWQYRFLILPRVYCGAGA